MTNDKNPLRDGSPRLSDLVRAAALKTLTTGGACASPERLHAAVAGTLPTAEARSVLAHAASCGPCSAELVLAQQFERPIGANEASDVEAILARVRRPVAAPAPLRRVAPARRWASFVLAAAAVLLLGITVGPRLFDSPPPIGDPSNLTRGNEIVLDTPLGVVASGSVSFTWSDVPGAVTYLVTVRTADETTLVIERNSSENRLDLATGGTDAELQSGSVYTWSVRAMGAGGDIVGQSGTATFQLQASDTSPR